MASRSEADRWGNSTSRVKVAAETARRGEARNLGHRFGGPDRIVDGWGAEGPGEFRETLEVTWRYVAVHAAETDHPIAGVQWEESRPPRGTSGVPTCINPFQGMGASSGTAKMTLA